MNSVCEPPKPNPTKKKNNFSQCRANFVLGPPLMGCVGHQYPNYFEFNEDFLLFLMDDMTQRNISPMNCSSPSNSEFLAVWEASLYLKSSLLVETPEEYNLRFVLHPSVLFLSKINILFFILNLVNNCFLSCTLVIYRPVECPLAQPPIFEGLY